MADVLTVAVPVHVALRVALLLQHYADSREGVLMGEDYEAEELAGELHEAANQAGVPPVDPPAQQRPDG